MQVGGKMDELDPESRCLAAVPPIGEANIGCVKTAELMETAGDEKQEKTETDCLVVPSERADLLYLTWDLYPGRNAGVSKLQSATTPSENVEFDAAERRKFEDVGSVLYAHTDQTISTAPPECNDSSAHAMHDLSDNARTNFEASGSTDSRVNIDADQSSTAVEQASGANASKDMSNLESDTSSSSFNPGNMSQKVSQKVSENVAVGVNFMQSLSFAVGDDIGGTTVGSSTSVLRRVAYACTSIAAIALSLPGDAIMRESLLNTAIGKLYLVFLKLLSNAFVLVIVFVIWNKCRPGVSPRMQCAMVLLALAQRTVYLICFYLFPDESDHFSNQILFIFYVLELIQKLVIPMLFVLWAAPVAAKEQRTWLQTIPLGVVAFAFWATERFASLLNWFGFDEMLKYVRIFSVMLVIPCLGALVGKTRTKAPSGHNTASAVIQIVALDFPISIGSAFMQMIVSGITNEAIVLIAFSMTMGMGAHVWNALSMETVPRCRAFEHLEHSFMVVYLKVIQYFFKQMFFISVITFSLEYFTLLLVDLATNLIDDSAVLPVAIYILSRCCARADGRVLRSGTKVDSELNVDEEMLHRFTYRSVAETHRRRIAVKMIAQLAAVLATITSVGMEILIYEALERPECCEPRILTSGMNASKTRALCLDRGDDVTRQLRALDATSCPRLTGRHTREGRMNLMFHFLSCLVMICVEIFLAPYFYRCVHEFGKKRAEKKEAPAERTLGFYGKEIESVRNFIVRHQFYIISAIFVSLLQSTYAIKLALYS